MAASPSASDRRSFLGGALGLGVLPWLGACGRGDRGALVMGDQVHLVESRMKAAGQLDDLPYRITWANFPGAAPLLEALNAGAVDTAPAGDLPVILAAAAGCRLKIAAVTRMSDQAMAIVVPRGSTIQSVADLAGQSVIVSSARGSISHYMLLEALNEARIPISSVRIGFSHRVVFDDTLAPTSAAVDVRRPEEWVLPTGQANGPVLWNALAIAAIYDGVARAARDWLAGYLNDRASANLGAPLATLPRVQEKFGEIEALLQVNRTLIFSAAQAADRGELPSADSANIVKHVATTNAIQAVAIGLELTGNPGISRNHPLERHYRDVLCSRIHSPQADTILIGAGRAGLSR